MATKNSDSTRFFSSKHEDSIAKALGAHVQPNSGATKFKKGDLVHNTASMLIEAKCCMTSKQSVAIKKDWIDKNRAEALSMRISNQAICINFEPDGSNFYVINERLMRFLVEKLSEDNDN